DLCKRLLVDARYDPSGANETELKSPAAGQGALRLLAWSPTWTGGLMVFRCLRPLRIFSLVPQLRRVVYELVRGFREIFMVSVLLFVFIFIFAIYGGSPVRRPAGHLQRSQQDYQGGVRRHLRAARCSSPGFGAGGPAAEDPGAQGAVPRRLGGRARDILMSRVHPSHADYIHLFVFIGCLIGLTLFAWSWPNYSENKGTALLTVDQRRWLDLKGRIKLTQPLRIPPRPNVPRRQMGPGQGSGLRCGAERQWLDDLMVDKQTNYTKYSVSQVLAMCAVTCTLLFVVAESWRNRFDASVTVAGVLWLVLLVTSLGRQDAQLRSFAEDFGWFVVVFRLFTLAGKHPTLKMLMLTVLMSTFKSFFIILGMFLLLLVYALSGVILFGNVKHGGGLNRQANFSHCWRATLLLLRIVTGEDWNKIMHDCMVAPPFCKTSTKFAFYYKQFALLNSQFRKQSVETPTAAIVRPLSLYFCSFYIIISYIMLNILVAIIMENFSLFYTNDEDALLSHTDIRQFQNTWNLLDDSRRGSISLRKCKILLRMLTGRLQIIDSGKLVLTKQLFKHMIYELEKLHGPGDVSFHDVLIMVAYRSVDIRKSLQLPELLARQELEFTIEEEVAKQTIKDWLDSCVKRKRATRPPSAARPAADALAVAAGASIGGQVWLCSRRRRREGGKLVSEAQRRRLLRIDDLGGGSGRPASLTMGAKRRRPARAANPPGVATVSAMAARSPTKILEAAGDGRDSTGAEDASDDADYDEENRDVIGGIERRHPLRRPAAAARRKRRSGDALRAQQLPGSEGLVEEQHAAGPGRCLVAKDLEDAFDEEDFLRAIFRAANIKQDMATSKAPPVSTADDGDGSDSDCQIVGCTLSPPKKQPSRQSSLFDFFRPKSAGCGGGGETESASKRRIGLSRSRKRTVAREASNSTIWITSLAAALSSGRKRRLRRMRRLMKMTKRRGTPRRRMLFEQPYYARWFAHIVSTVSEDADLAFLFSPEQRHLLAAAARLSPERPELRLLARLLCRARRFHRPGRLRYPELGAPPELAAAGLASSAWSRASPKRRRRRSSLNCCRSSSGGGRARRPHPDTAAGPAPTRCLAGLSAQRRGPPPHAGCAAPSWPPSGRPAWRLRPAAADLLEAAFLAFHIELHDTEAANVFQLGAEPEPLPAELVQGKATAYCSLPCGLERRLRDLQQRRQFLQLEDAFTEAGWPGRLQRAIDAATAGALAAWPSPCRCTCGASPSWVPCFARPTFGRRHWNGCGATRKRRRT
uniref:Ion_trans domain-containing protein n=1 Tax=Macrostomum lignano TaxID=282301 RepID=A0A1I8JS47_9PLAT